MYTFFIFKEMLKKKDVLPLNDKFHSHEDLHIDHKGDTDTKTRAFMEALADYKP